MRRIKDSSANWEQALQLIHHHNDVIGTFIGWHSYIYKALVEGAAGVMAGAANVVPEDIVAVARGYRRRRPARCPREMARVVSGHRRDDGCLRGGTFPRSAISTPGTGPTLLGAPGESIVPAAGLFDREQTHNS